MNARIRAVFEDAGQQQIINQNFVATFEFFEGGVNLSELGLGNECFSSVASETRSSTSTTAVLKDFVLGQLASEKGDNQTAKGEFAQFLKEDTQQVETVLKDIGLVQ